MNLLAQTQSEGVVGILERAPTDEIMIMFIVFIVFSTLLLIVVTWCITSTIRSIRIASIHSQLTEKLVREGVPYEHIERLIRANGRRIRFPIVCLPSKWQRGESRMQQVPGKPA